MGVYIIRRLITLIPTLIVISFLSFVFVRLIPGDPAVIMLGERARKEDVEKYKEQMGLNQPILVQYGRYVEQVLQGNLGNSIVNRVSVTSQLAYRLPATIEAIFGALFIGIILGVVMGVIAAIKRNTPIDTLANLIALTGVSMPVFWLALIMIYLFGVNLKILPPGARVDANINITPVTGFYLIDSLLMGRPDYFLNVIKHLILPSVVLSFTIMPSIMRLTRASMLEVMRTDYVRTARAKGLNNRSVLLKHALRNAMLPVITVIGDQAAALLNGAVVVETIFGFPGVGKLMIDAILQRDFNVVLAAIMVTALAIFVMNLLIDLAYSPLDPRIRH